jgi:hypothetical protein
MVHKSARSRLPIGLSVYYIQIKAHLIPAHSEEALKARIDIMKSWLWLKVVAMCFAVGGPPVLAANYYVNDSSTNNDVWCSDVGHPSNPGTTNAPKATLANVVATCNLQPGDVVYIDTGTYPSGTVVSNTVNGTALNPIRFQGSTSTNGSTVLTGGLNNLSVQGSYLNFADIRSLGGEYGVELLTAKFCTLERFWAISNITYAFHFIDARSNQIRRCVAAGGGPAVRMTSGAGPSLGNNLEYSVFLSAQAPTLRLSPASATNMVGCIIGGTQAFISSNSAPAVASFNLFYGVSSFGSDVETLSDLQRINPSWIANTYADPKFVNEAGFDFHLQSPAGCISNRAWVTNATLSYSPAIDFGPTNNMAYTNEPTPNGTRVNIGLYGGTVEASKSRTNAWLFAASFNDGGSLIQTGRLEWVGGNLGGASVNVQFSTNSGVAWSNIATGLAGTNESYTWVPSVAQQHPAVLWRVVVGTNAAIVSTNAKPFAVRAQTNTVFSFYVNDASTNNDVYCSVAGNNASNGLSLVAPKQTLQAILDAYALAGGDTVYVDTGNYNALTTTVMSAYDSGLAGQPVRIVGSPKGAVFSRSSTSADTLQIVGARFVEMTDFQFNDGRSGVNGVGASDIQFRRVQFLGNQYGVSLVAPSTRNTFEGCLAANNAINAFSGSGSQTNQWLNGVMWNSPTAIVAQSTALSVSNSILGGGTALFGEQVIPGDFNLVWQTAVGLSYATFSALQNASFGWGRSLFADPQFANAAGGDFHLKSTAGRWNPASSNFVIDAVHSSGIDLGNPAAAYANEPTNNGSRLNVGMFGNTAQASKSITNLWLQTLSYMDGGTLDAQAGSWLRWTGSAFASSNRVTLWLSRDGGSNWVAFATNVVATNGQYFYQNTSTNDSSSLFARWRVTLNGYVPEVSSQTPTNFNYKNGPYFFYVNDASTNHDVYCTAKGNDSNLGVSEGSPKASLAALLQSYPLKPGDRVYVDTGTYYFPATPVVLTSQHSGLTTNLVWIIGSTNRVAGGSQFGASGNSIALGFDFQAGSSNIVMRDIVVVSPVRGVSVANADNIKLEQVEVRGALDKAFDLQANARSIELLRCVAHGGAIGVALQQATNVNIRHSVFWQNQNNAVYAGTQVGLRVENSIMASTNANAALYSVANFIGFASDYNCLYAGRYTRIGVNRTAGTRADNLAAWQALSGGQDLRSLSDDPRLANPAQYDYHLKTEQTLGRWLPNGDRTSDSVSSPLLDAGNPASDSAQEPVPNGGRVNIGRFGGTAEASIALPTPWLKTVSFGDAGGVTNGTVPLRWTAGGGFSNETVKVEVSVDGGKTWGTTVTASMPATNGLANWTVAGLPDTPAAVWRVACLERTNVLAQSATFFAIRNSPLNLFLATADTNNAVYTTGPGLPDNWRATSNAPLNSLATAFDRFDLEPGDQIWMDTGTYEESVPVAIGMKNSGSSNNPIRVTGNRKIPYSGSVLKRVSRTVGANGMQLAEAEGVLLQSLVVSNAWVGIHAENSRAIALERVRVANCATNNLYVGAGSRVDLTGSILEQSLATGLHAHTGAVVKIFSSLIRDAARASVLLQGGDVEIKNSILLASGSQRYVYYWGSPVSKLASDFNNVRVDNSANVAGGDGRPADRFLIDWQTSSARSNDMSSFGYEPRFHAPAALDFHLQSQYGRYDPACSCYVTTDTNTSALIDLGDRTFAFANEPTNNGGRINVGLYGNSVEASKSSGQGTLVPLTMSDGGTVRGLATLFWSFNGISNNARVIVQFSADAGQTWTNITTNGPVFADVGTTGQPWYTTNYQSTAQGVWRVMTTNVPPIIGQTEIPFAVKNEPAAYYVNDGRTNGDVYCASAIGRATNSGLRADSPLNSLETLLGKYKVEHGDTVYVDTGIYPRNSPLVISIPSVGITNRLIIQGSTNEAAGGTVFTNSSGAVVEFQDTRGVELRDLNLLGGDRGLLFTKSSSNRLLRVRSDWAKVNAFELNMECDQNQFIQCVALNFSRTGFHMATASGTILPATNYWSSGVISPVPATSNGVAASTGVLVGARSGRIYVSNSVFVANGPRHTIYSVGAEAIRGDYNCYHQPYTNSFAWVYTPMPPAYGVEIRTPGSLGEWSEWNQSESNSMAADPLFADLAAGDLHPKSQGGRYAPASDSLVEDEETSPLIDTADPLAPWNLEPLLNGGRADIGPYGNHPHASRSPTNGTFVLLTLNQGGVVRGTQVLKWVARGKATEAGRSVLIQISTNSGANFQTIRTNSTAQGAYSWNSTSAPSLASARWRLRDEGVAIWSTSADRDFVIHNSNLTYYVNDASTSNDVYSSVPGAAVNTGLGTNSPLPSLRDVLARFDLEPGDQVLIDAGDYAQNAPITLGFVDSGTQAEPARIQGATNAAGSAFSGAGLQLENARGFTLRDLRFVDQTARQSVVSIAWSENVVLEQVDVLSGSHAGVEVGTSSNVFLRNFVLAGVATNGLTSLGSYGTRLEFGVIWSNGVSQILSRNQLASGFMPERELASVTVSNCVLGTFGIRKPVYEIRGNVWANHNALVLRNGGLAALSYVGDFGREYDSVQGWTQATGKDDRSLSQEPRFANPAVGDFHLLSSAGRYDPAITNFVLDPPSDNSPLIDAGNPNLVCTEPTPNGNRVNIGRFGNTSQASKTPTNCALALISFNDGGRAVGTNVPVTWVARGAATNGPVTISYSANAGANWTVLAGGVPATNGLWIWNSTLSQQSVEAKLKIESPSGCGAISEKVFSVRNTNYFFYVNDGATNNDVYCTAMGDNANSGLTNSKPMADLNALLARYDLDSGDVVYIDTGNYSGNEPWRITQADTAGDLGLPPVVFQGSTNSTWGGTVLDRRANTIGIQVDYAVGVRLRNIAISNTVGSAVLFNDCYDAAAEWIAVGVGNVGFRLSGGSQLRLAHCIVWSANQGAIVENWTKATNTVFPVIEHCVFWETDGSALEIKGENKTTAKNNLFSVAPGQYVYEMGFAGELVTDYNSIWLENGGRVFRQDQLIDVSPVPIIYETVGSWAAASGQDIHSYDGDPLLADPAIRDFHLKSRAGRFVPGAGWTNDAVSSPLIDAGTPDSSSWTLEPPTNGGRVNIGLHGGTPWASKSSTNSALYLLTLNRGGVVSGQVALNWQPAGLATGHMVRLEVSIDNGSNWVRVATNVAASRGGVIWNSLALPSSPLARWRVQDEQETNVSATSELNFVLHNEPIRYYVNDDFPAGDVYCSGVGSSSNSGASAASPKRWISEILDTYNLEPGDVVYVDTGRYQTPQSTFIGDLDSGDISQDPSRQVTLLGSTNEVAGGSLYIITGADAAGFQLQGAYGVRFKHLGIQGASNGLALSDSYFIAGEWVTIRDCENGVRANQSSNVVLSQVALAGNRGAGVRFFGNSLHSMKMDSCLLWSNRYGVYLQQGYAQVFNSVLGMKAPGSVGFYIQADASQSGFQSDYNNLYVGQPNAYAVAEQRGVIPNARTTTYSSASSWAQASGQDQNSLVQNPELADPDNGDYHPKSTGGRFKPGIGWIMDTNSSPLIDAGNPQLTGWINEPDPNGRRLNMGLYGGSAEASKTPEDGWIVPLYPNGGSVAGFVDLKWAVGGRATNNTLTIEYSGNNGVTWTNIVAGWPASFGTFRWDSVPYGRSALARWRLFCDQDPSIEEMSGRFTLKNAVDGVTIPYFVNDASTNGDVYCTARGDEDNDGLTPATPKDSLQAILDAYQLAPVDVVYVDAGAYSAGAPPIKIDQTDSGYSNLYVTIQGSTNPLAATVFQAPGGFSTPNVFLLEYAVNVRLKNLTIRNARIGVETFQAIGCELDNVRIEDNPATGINLVKTENFRVLRSVLWNNASLTAGVAAIVVDSSMAVENSVFWGSPVAVSVVLGKLTVTNSALQASGSGGRIYLFGLNADATNDFRGDYNSYTRLNGALVAEQPLYSGGSDYYNDMPVWSRTTSSDAHSMVVNPLFDHATQGDFHPRSTKGRFSDLCGCWTNDSATNVPPNSPLVDAGSPAWPADKEPEPNGDIINVGAYGNTGQASMTQTNPPWLRTISYNEPGIIDGLARLYWLHGGMPPDALVRLEYSTDYEITWHTIANNRAAGDREFVWDVSLLPLTRALYWRVKSQANTNIYDVSDFPVTVKPGNFTFYVNDGSTNGDIWCKGPGLPCDGGANPTNPAQPAESLACLLAQFPVGAGDRILVDTGIYPATDAARTVLDDRHAGTETKPLKIYASTNFQAGGALFVGNGTANGIDAQNTRFIELYDFRLSQAQHGLSMQNVANITVEGLESFNNRSNGVWVLNGADMTMSHARLWKNGRYGYASSANASGGQDILNSVLWGNAFGAVYNDKGTLNVSNSILCVTNATDIYTEAGIWEMTGDYNLYGLVSRSRIGTNVSERTAYANLRQWQKKARDVHSVVLDPLFVNPVAGDFHLQSRAGYRSNGTWAVSLDTSWGIDGGDPASLAYTNEPATNGLQLNLGAYGGTPAASRTDSSVPELLPTTLRDGGVAPYGQPFFWRFRGISPTNLVRIDYSPDSGSNWVQVVSGRPVDSAPYVWEMGPAIESTPKARWRVVLLANTNVYGATPTNFILRPRPITYYVNDANPTNDIFTTAPGTTNNLGFSSNSPLNSIQAVLNNYQLISDDGGDEIKVDTGVYVLTNSVRIDPLSSGNPTNSINIRGSTNLAAGGSWFQATPGLQAPAFLIDNGRYVNLSNLRLSGFSNGVSFFQATGCTLTDLDIQRSIGPGVLILQGLFIRLQSVLIREGLTNGVLSGASKFVNLDGCVLWSNRYDAISTGNSDMFVTNSVLEASGLGVFCYSSGTGATIRADYNNLFFRNGAQVAFIDGLQYDRVPQWVRATGQDVHSLSTDPLFHSPTNGDFHLRSATGRYNPTNGWEQDVPPPPPALAAPVRLAGPCGGVDPGETNAWTPFSPLIDMGSPRVAWSNEPTPNGGRRNIGLFGGTWQASMSNTNQWLLAVTAMSGGITYGRINLIWGFGGGIPTNAMSRLEYSFDNGNNWTRIGESAVGTGEYVWDSDLKLAGAEIWPSSPAARWRIFLLDNTNVWDRTDAYFGLRNSPFKYYLNDTSTNNDVYATAVGDDCNLGFFPAAPKLTMANLLQNVDLDPTDQIFVDTGTYRMNDTNAPVRWEASDGGALGQPVLIRGSTHTNGSLIVATNAFAGPGFFFMEANYVDLQDLRFAGESLEFKGLGLAVRNLRLTNGSLRVYSEGSAFSEIKVDRGNLILSGQGNRMERLRQRWGTSTILGTNVVMVNSAIYATNHSATGILVHAINAVVSNATVVSARGTAIGKRGPGTLRLGHCILVADGTESSSVIAWEDGGLRSDWNNLLARGSAWIGNRDGKWEKLAYWQAASGLDANSVSFEPLLQHEDAGDFHLNSKAGRWNEDRNEWDYGDSTTSPLIDLGDPWIGTGEEPLPNGYRRNLGAYGGTEQASKSPTNFWLTALTQNDGGVLKGSNVVLRWAAGNADGKSVTLQYFNGSQWTNIATGLSATYGSYAWNTTAFPDSFNARWRVVGEGDTNVWDQTDTTFPLRNQAQSFYLNDADPSDDLYCSDVGSDSNNGLTPATPMQTLQALFNLYDLEGGDTVYLDTGTYPAAADIRLIWSRSGSTNADVVIQGNTNGAVSILTRSGLTNFPATGLDVKASRIQLNHLAIRGMDRGLLLDSNRNVSVVGMVVGNATTGIAVENAHGTQIRNSAFDRTGVGVSLLNTRTSVLENLTFALSSVAGIQLNSTVLDTLQNNIFIPDLGGYAYAIGTATSLLANAVMDYNLYDFSRVEDIAFYAGATNDLRTWQLSMNRDFRSAITNADLADRDFGDFHPRSEYGRWAATNSWVLDTNTSWAVDHANPAQDYSREPPDNGSRRNIGRYGNTVQASKGSTNISYEIRTLNSPGIVIPQNDQTWPLVWSTHLVDPGEEVLVQFSADGGLTWSLLTNASAYAEYYIFTARAEFQTENGRWRVIGVNDTNLLAESCCDFRVKFFDLGFLTSPKPVNGLMRMDWVGGLGGLRYRLEYSDDFGKNWKAWEEKYNGPAPINRTDFVIPSGGAKLSYTFEDRTSYLRRTRWYRIWEVRD